MGVCDFMICICLLATVCVSDVTGANMDKIVKAKPLQIVYRLELGPYSSNTFATSK